MKPARFEYFAPESRAEALELLAQHEEAKPLAGGQSLVPAMNFRLARPAVLVDLNRIADLAGITVDEGLRIGAMTRQVALERSADVAHLAPLVAEAMPHVAHAPIRNRGTVGGNLAHADPASELPAVMVALGARFRLQSSAGERWVPAEKFFLGLFATLLQPGELLVEIAIPAPAAPSGHAFTEVSRRHGDYALAGAAAAVRLNQHGECVDARVVLFGVADGPWLAVRANDLLLREKPDADRIAAAAESVRADVDPPSDIHASGSYRRHLAGVLTRRVLERAFSRVRVSA
ncbi:MAG TPA: xanthine dehydrogenase family protein subunit M [Gemmatimonadales bacterium]|nr:xanthine dehydrogenase family protein subunit M [Gemmatimonadales bacterium]